MSSGYIYLASPYSDLDPTVRHDRFLAACKVCVESFKLHIPMFSPIVHWHPIAIAVQDFPTDYLSFKAQNDAMVASSDEVHVLMLDGWKLSRGVAYEIKFAESLGKKLFFRGPAR